MERRANVFTTLA